MDNVNYYMLDYEEYLRYAPFRGDTLLHVYNYISEFDYEMDYNLLLVVL